MKYKGYLICTDMDGTFCKTDKNFEAIRKFQEGGGLFTVATGRNTSYIDEYFSALPIKPNAPAIMCNGSVIFDYEQNKIIKEHFLPEDAYEEFYNIATKFDVMIRFALRGGTPENEHHFASETAVASDRAHFYKAVWHTLDKMDLLEPYIYEKLSGRYELSKSCSSLIEANPKGISKSSGTLFVKEYTKCHTLICVGDYGNDIPMLKTADISYAVENATEEVKKSAMRITVKNTDSAIAEIIESI